MVRTLFIVAAALGMAAVSGLHEHARGQAGLDGIYAGRITTMGRCALQNAEVNVSIQGAAVTGLIVSPTGRTQFAGTLDGNQFSIETTGTSETRVAVEGQIAFDGTKLDVKASISQCTAQGQLNKRP